MAKKKIPTVQTIKKRTIEDMRSLGVYRKQYRDLIDVYADTYHAYLLAQKEFEDNGRRFETLTAAGNPKKSGIVDSLEKLRKDIIAYSDRLCLSPKSMESVTADKQNKSKLANVLSKLDET